MDDAVLEFGSFYKQCDSRARLEIYPAGPSYMLIKCVCARAQEVSPPSPSKTCKLPCKHVGAGFVCGPPLTTAGCTSFTTDYSL